MKRAWLITALSMTIPALLAACGGSSKTSSTASASGGSAAPASATTNRGGAYGGGAYGSPASSSASGASGGSASGGSGGSGSATAIEVTTKHSKLGTILAAGSKQLTVYLFEGDKGSTSSCSGACASAWPPVTTSTKALAGGQAVTADLATITRSNGSKQVTYKGHPLYYFARDKDSGDAYGEGVKAFGADWYALAPSGQKVDNS